MSEPTPELYRKLALAVAEVSAVSKSKTADTGKYKYSYADLTDVLHAVKDACQTAGLVILQPINTRDGNLYVDTLVIDKGTGDFLHFPGPALPTKGDPQAAGSAITYLRRYALTSMFAMEVSDDDGAQATRAARDPHHRTQAETDVRKIIGSLSKEDQALFVADFRQEFGTGLTELPESRHGDALAFAKFWAKDEEAAIGEETP
jgi:hypothetical protein